MLRNDNNLMKKKMIFIKTPFSCLLLTAITLFSPFALSEITLDGSMGATGSLAGPDYQITEDLGQRAGSNLFHSFGKFNINSAESATFSGSAGINNVISRVTGGQASTIDGAFQSTIPGANIYFLNPSGVIFGENASLDVQGSFHASTADYLKFKDGVKFETGLANANPNPILTIASPEAFGFLDDTPAPITVSGGLNKVLKVPEGETLSLVAGDISINDRSLYAPSGQVVLASAGSAGEVVFNESGIDTSSFSQGGKIHLSRLAENPVATINNTMRIADIDVSADAAGKVVIRGGQMVMDNANVWANTTNKDGGDIDIGLAGDLTINGVAEISGVEKTPESGIVANSLGNGTAGNIVLNVDGLKLTHNSKINSIAASSGNGGDILINANAILLEGNDSKATPSINIITGSTGNAGNLSINDTDYLEINKGSGIMAGSSGKGHGGDVSIDAATILVSDKKTYISNSPFDAGNSGNLIITTDNFKIQNGAIISASNSGSGNNGDIIINAHNGNILLSESYIFNTSLANSTGNLGSIIINANDLQIQGNAKISGFVQSGANNQRIIQINSQSVTISGEGSRISTGTIPASFSLENPSYSSNNDDTVNATPIELNIPGHLALRDGAFISTTTTTNGRAGDISINAGSIELSEALIYSDASSYVSDTQQDTSRTGNAGNISITTQFLDLTNGSIISSDTETAGLGGNITVDAKSVFLSGMRPSKDDLLVYSHISTKTNSEDNNAGNAGSTTLNNVDQLKIQDGYISVNSFGAGSGGNLSVNAKSIIISGKNSPNLSGLLARTSSDNDNAGNAGNIVIKSEHIDLSDDGLIDLSTTGAGKGGNLNITADTMNLSGKNTPSLTGIFISTKSIESNAGSAGDANITVGHLNISDTAIISASTHGNGDGGNLTIDAQSITLKGDGANTFTGITSQANGTTDGKIGYQGNAGDLTLIVEDSLNLHSGAEISASTFDEGKAGDLSITASDILLNDSWIVSSSNLSEIALSNNPEIAKSGNIVISANNTLTLENNSAISVKTEKANAGEITILGENILTLRDSNISTSVANGEGNGGNITVKSPVVSLDNSQIIAQAKVGDGGNISVPGILFKSPLSVIDASSEKSTPGELNLTPDTNISGSIAVLPESLLNASEHLNDSCNTRSGKSTNSFVVKGKGGIPLSPDKPVSSDFMDFLPVLNSSHNVLKNKSSHQVNNNYQLPSLSVDCFLSSNTGK